MRTALTWAAVVALTGCAALGGARAGGLDLGHDIELDDQAGRDALKLEPDDDGVELEDGQGETLASYRLDSGGIRVKSAAGKKLAFVALDPGRKELSIREQPDAEPWVRLRSEDDGDIKVQVRGQLAFEIKTRDYGRKVETASGDEHAKVRVQDGKTTLRSVDRDTHLSTRDEISPLALACFSLDLLSLEVRAGLALAVIHWQWP